MEVRQDKYWICDVCALRRDWKPFKTAYTVIAGLCGWCEATKEDTLTPLRDLRNADGIRADCERSE